MTGIKLSPWTVTDDYCAMRYVEGTDPEKVENRVAFIEKTPRIRTGAYDHSKCWSEDWVNWTQGPKGSGGPDGHIPENELYGFYPPSREWCDEELVKLGYILG